MNTPLHPDDISRFITGRIIGSLAAGQVPWRGTMPGLPEYALTGEPFTGVGGDDVLHPAVPDGYPGHCGHWQQPDRGH
ncbi:hypothetical protein QQ130_002650 [Salmonella enterica]|nr:hypothetical protein [Salmonella enterica]EKH8241073.1 hypothetical protein [Salmonella enterica]ELD4337454.1 hypothetical protein [Salmonella enterica]ELQ7085582.1 hypothetical protein [Salmonella enterica]